MLAIIKYLALFRHGLPILAAITAMLLLETFIFEDFNNGSTILVVVMLPYLDMFAVTSNKQFSKSVDLALPLGFNKLWITKIFCFYIYLAGLALVFGLQIFFLSDDVNADMIELLRSSLVMYMILFVFGKVMLFRRGNYKLVVMSIISIAMFVLIMFSVKRVSALESIESNLTYSILIYTIPLTFISFVDYIIALKNRNMLLGAG